MHGNTYGTSLQAVADVCTTRKIPVLDIDVQGAALVHKSVVGARAVGIFIAPPSLEELEARLRGRATESEDRIAARLANAAREMEQTSKYNEVVVNADIEQAYIDLMRAIEKHIPGTFSEHDLAAPAAASADAPVEASAPPVKTASRPPSQPAAAAAPHSKPPTPPAAPPPGSANSQQRSPRVTSRAAAAVAAAQAAQAPGGALHMAPSAATAPAPPGAKGLPVRQYMDVTVIPVLREALRALNEARPHDPLQFLADQLLAARAKLATQH